MPGIEVVGIFENVPLKKRVIVRPKLFELILEITLSLCGISFRVSRNLYLRHGPGSLSLPQR